MEKDRLRILLIGNGGREHALAWKLNQSPRVDIIYVVPGNGGTARDMRNVRNVTSVKAEDFPGLVAFAKEHEVNLVVPGPEAPLVAGIEGFFRAAGIRCFGPTKAAARMEGSKAFSKDFMTSHHIPTAGYKKFTDYELAKEYLNEFLDNVSPNIVLKASGLAAGKGVIIPSSKEEAHDALHDIMKKKEFGAAGDEVVIEEFVEGDELSFLTFSDGYTIRSLPPAQDHKQIYTGDFGPNTGGMGCYAPTKIATPHLIKEVHRTILQPTIDGMRKQGLPFVGILFTGLMITKDGPKVLEYNVRFGDPETQTLLPLMSADTDLAEIMVACTDHYLDAISIKIEHKFSATVVAAAGGYPGPYVRGDIITLKPPPSDIIIFHAGTALASQDLTTSGGRVIAATSTAATLDAAVMLAYTGISTIHFPNMHHRTDIGHRALDSSIAPAPQAHAKATPLTYASAGVDITSGNTLVKRITSHVSSTARSGAPADLGGFGGLFDLAAAGYNSPPTLIGAIDGVGTKLRVAHAMNKHNTVGIDLVAMNVNDLVVQGAEPLFFLDCYSCGKLDVDVAESFVSGVATGCREAGCALIGGETAEMPGMFASDGGYDAVGATVGAVQHGRKLLPDKAAMEVGDVLLGLASSGCHSNGFSLVRKIVENAGLTFQDQAPWAEGMSVGESLLTPTKIYVKPILKTVQKDLVKGLSHITGGGLVENVPRMLPDHLAAEIDVSSWEMPPVMNWLKKEGDLEDEEFARVLNTGLGMVLVVAKQKLKEAIDEFREAGEVVKIIGSVVERRGEGCVLRNLGAWR